MLLVGGSQVEAKMLAEARYVERMTGQNPNHGRVHLDLADMHLFQDGSFDLVMACHVLEHVHRLSKGLEEVYRVLRKGCSAVFCVPIPRRAKTIAFERADRQGHWYSVGRDWPDAYRDTGFEVRESKGTDCPVSYGVRAENIVSVCTRS